MALAWVLLLVSCTTSRPEVVNNSIIPLSNKNRNAHSVYLTKTNNNEAAICWTEQDSSAALGKKYVYYSIFDAAIGRFTDTIQIPIAQQTALHTEGMPKIAFKADGTVFAVYEVEMESDRNPYASEIHYTLSKDRGLTWSAPRPVHASHAPHQGRSFFDVATLTNGEIGVSWLGESSSGGGRPVVFARTDTADLFIDEHVVDSLACECCRTALYADESGLVSIVYRDIIAGGIRDISVVTSIDTGKTFSVPSCFSGDNWNINGCPHNGPDVVSDGAFVYATWYTGGAEAGVYFARLDNAHRATKKELVAKDGRNIQLANLGEGTNMLVYSEGKYTQDGFASEIKAIVKPAGQHIQVSRKGIVAHSPVAIAINGSVGLIAWVEKAGQRERVFYKIVRPN